MQKNLRSAIRKLSQHKLFHPLATLFLSCFLCLASWAQTQYVTDQLDAQLRAGTGNEYKIIAFLRSGRSVQILKSNAGNGYSQIKVGNTSGYILTRHLSTEPSPKERLEKALARIEPLKSENDQLKAQLTEMKSTLKQTQAQNKELIATNDQVKQTLARIQKTSANAVAIDTENKELKEVNIKLENELEITRQKNLSLKTNSDQVWFMYGGFIALLGLILGLLIPRLKLRPDQRWSNQL